MEIARRIRTAVSYSSAFSSLLAHEPTLYWISKQKKKKRTKSETKKPNKELSEERLEKGSSDDLPSCTTEDSDTCRVSCDLDRGSPSHFRVTILWALHNSLNGSGGMLDSGK